MWNPFKMFFPKKKVGIDIGTSAIKIVEISRWGQGKTLENYGEIKSEFISKEPLLNAKKSNSLVSNTLTAKAIKAILNEARIKTRSVVFSIPDFSTFCTSFEIPPMPEKEISGAISYNASQYITLPIKEVTLDWKIVPNPIGDKNSPIKVFLVAVPNQVIQDYQTIAKMAGLEIYALEAEALSITRVLASNNKKTICLMDIGVQSSTVNIIENGFLRRSYSFSFYSGQLSRAISSALGIELDQAEEIKNKEGLISQKEGLSETLYPLIDPLLVAIKSISSEFFQSEKKKVEEIYLTGGTANLPGLKEYFTESLKIPVYVPNCFAGFLYAPILDKTLKELSLSFSVAVGAALSALEK